MSKIRGISLAATLALSGVMAHAGTAAGQDAAKIMVGTLTCKGRGTVGLILGSKETLDCNFVPAGQAPQEGYVGTITKIGLDVGVKGQSTMIWTVLFSTSTLPAGALAGQYVGAAADASVGAGVGAKLLVGGTKSKVSLQPVSVQGQSGLNLAVGVAGLKLAPR